MYWIAFNEDRSQIHYGHLSKVDVYDQEGFEVEYYTSSTKLKKRIKELE